MRIVILMPWRPDGSTWRSRNFDLASAQAASLGYPVYTGSTDDEPFSIGRTWNRLAERAGDWDYAVRWAADFLLDDPHEQVHAAIEHPGDYVCCFNANRDLNAAETTRMHNGEPAPGGTSRLRFGGPNVVTRRLWDTTGGFDERFTGWGHEDRDFVDRAERLFGPRRRVPGRMLNLWHPRKVKGDPYWEARHANRKLRHG